MRVGLGREISDSSDHLVENVYVKQELEIQRIFLAFLSSVMKRYYIYKKSAFNYILTTLEPD